MSYERIFCDIIQGRAIMDDLLMEGIVSQVLYKWVVCVKSEKVGREVVYSDEVKNVAFVVGR